MEYQIDFSIPVETGTDTLINFLDLVSTDDAYCPLYYEVRYTNPDGPLETDNNWLTHDVEPVITINTNDNNNDHSASPLELKIITFNEVNSVESILSLTILPDCS